MRNISQSKLLRPWTWIGRRKKPPIVLPRETLTHILHYFPRKQLVKRYSRVNSSFFQVANRLLPNVHVIKSYNISFSEDEMYNSGVRTFKALTLGKYQYSSSIFEKAMNKITKKRITAAEYLENMPPAFIRFPKFSIRGCPDEVLLKFLRDSKQNFENCRLYFHKYNPDEKLLQKVEEMLTDTFLKPSEIEFDQRFASDKIFKTTGVRNCDRVVIWNDSERKCTKEAFIEWIQWKQNESGSRRHLVLTWWSFDGIIVQEMMEDLKHAFETATQPLSYVITFVTEYHEYNVGHPGEFHLDNEQTGERLSLFKDKKRCFRLWRRTVTSSDSTWLWKKIDGKRSQRSCKKYRI
ncbi:hypothetical protein Ddc_14566 [Ditylenchus destructor]|nr:hypothetical protein Ddc_14566 [Ditylenchus destructor]